MEDQAKGEPKAQGHDALSNSWIDCTLTKKRCHYAAIYVDHFSGYGHVHLQKTELAEETLEGKAAFERHSQLNGVKILHYHADNDMFASKPWKDV
jgi:hypothetical protein